MSPYDLTTPQWVEFNGLFRTEDSQVHIVHTSRVIITYTLWTPIRFNVPTISDRAGVNSGVGVKPSPKFEWDLELKPPELELGVGSQYFKLALYLKFLNFFLIYYLKHKFEYWTHNMCTSIMTYLILSGGWLFCSHLSTQLVIIVVFTLKHIKIFIHSDDWIVIREEVVLDGSPLSTLDGSLASTPDGSLASTPHGSPRSTPRTPRRAGLPRTSRIPRSPRTHGHHGGNVRVLGTPGRAKAVHVQHHESGKEGITKATQRGRYEKAIGLLEKTRRLL